MCAALNAIIIIMLCAVLTDLKHLCTSSLIFLFINDDDGITVVAVVTIPLNQGLCNITFVIVGVTVIFPSDIFIP